MKKVYKSTLIINYNLLNNEISTSKSNNPKSINSLTP